MVLGGIGKMNLEARRRGDQEQKKQEITETGLETLCCGVPVSGNGTFWLVLPPPPEIFPFIEARAL